MDGFAYLDQISGGVTYSPSPTNSTGNNSPSYLFRSSNMNQLGPTWVESGSTTLTITLNPQQVTQGEFNLGLVLAGSSTTPTSVELQVQSNSGTTTVFNGLATFVGNGTSGST